MYQRSAVILEKYFAEKFYYKDRNSLKVNYENYKRLIEVLEKYQEITEEEDMIINECEEIADKIKQIQNNQTSLYKRNLKLEEDRNTLFESIDESAVDLSKQLERIEKEIDENNEQMKPIGKDFIEALAKFNETSQNRTGHDRRKRKIEREYRSILEKSSAILSEIDAEKVSDIKKMIAEDNTKSNEELKALMLKNGEKEKIPFDIETIESAIEFGQLINKEEAQILVDIYEKSNSLVNEIDSSSVKITKYKKLAKDAKSKLKFIVVKKEYLTQFLDNERLSVNLGKREHQKLMKNACEDFKKDIEQINNLNELLQKETMNKATQKMYFSLYNAEYLDDLQKMEKEFENKLDELNLTGKILNPNYWRIESIEKVYSTFDEIVIDEYSRDLSKYKIEEPDEDDSSEGYMEYYDKLEEENNPEDANKEHNVTVDESEVETDNEKEKEKSFSFGNMEQEDEEVETDKDEYIEDNDEEDYIVDETFDDEEDDEDDFEDEYDEDELDDGDEFDDDFEDSDEDEQEDEKFESLINNNESQENDNKYNLDYDEEDDNFEEENIDDDDNDDLYDYDDEEDEEEDEELDIILQNRKKILGKNISKLSKNKEKAPKKKGLFGLGTKK